MLGGVRLAGGPSRWDVRAAAPVVDADAAVALVSHIGFVGLTERWDESILLLHAMLDIGRPVSAELANVHLGSHARTNRTDGGHGGVHDASSLRGFVDEDDERVYAEATEVFEQRRAKHLRRIAELRGVAFGRAPQGEAEGRRRRAQPSPPGQSKLRCCENGGAADYERRGRRAATSVV